MIKNILQLTLVGYLWKRYKVVIISTVLLFVYFWLVGRIHEDFIGYSGLKDTKEYLGISFLIKWIALLVGIVVYLIINAWYRNRYNRQKAIKSSKAKLNNKTDNRKTILKQYEDQHAESGSADPFDEIRKKDKLSSRADLILDKNKGKSD